MKTCPLCTATYEGPVGICPACLRRDHLWIFGSVGLALGGIGALVGWFALGGVAAAIILSIPVVAFMLFLGWLNPRIPSP